MSNVDVVKKYIKEKGYVPLFVDEKLNELDYYDIKELVNGLKYEQHSFLTMCGKYVVDMETWFNDDIEKDIIVYDKYEYKDMVGGEYPW